MTTPSVRLYQLFNQRNIFEARTELLNMLVICATEYATRSPERNPENPFIASPKLVKTVLDADGELFEQLYYQLGNYPSLSALIHNANDWYNHYKVLPDLHQYFPYKNLKPATVRVLTIPEETFWPDHLELLACYNSALEQNDAYCQRNPNIRYLVDNEQGRIWVKHFENEGRKRAYWLNSTNAPDVFYKLMNNRALQELVERHANATASCESLLCEEVSMPLLAHDGRNWHVDKLADQIKVMLPLIPIDHGNGPMRWLENTLPEQLIEQQQYRSHIHHCFIYSGMKTTVANFIPNSLIEKLATNNEETAVANIGQAVMFDTRCIHSGSICTPGRLRKTLTLTYKINSLRNNALNSLPCFY